MRPLARHGANAVDLTAIAYCAPKQHPATAVFAPGASARGGTRTRNAPRGGGV